MTTSNLRKKEFVWAYDSRGIRVHHGGQARRQTGMQSEQEAERSHPQSQVQRRERRWR